MQKGSCNCGAITYEIDDDAKGAGMCYCRDCMKTSAGGALALFTDKGNFRVTRGEAKFWKTSATDSGKEARRFFCADCGTHIWAACDAYPSIVTVKVGTLDYYADVTLAMEIFTRNAIKSFQPAKDVGQQRRE